MDITATTKEPLELARQFVMSEDFKGLGKRLFEKRRRGEAFFLDTALARVGVDSFSPFLQALGEKWKIDFGQSVSQLMQTLAGSNRWLVPEVFLALIARGVRKGAQWPNWVAGSVTVTNPEVKIPTYDKPNFQAQRIKELEKIPTVTLSFAERAAYLFKYGLGFKLSYEVFEFERIDYYAAWVEEFGQGLADGLNAYYLSTLLTGNTDKKAVVIAGTAPATVGIITAGTIANLVYADIVEVHTMMSACNFTPDTIIANRAAIMAMANLAEFKTRALGIPAISMDLNGMALPTGYRIFQNETVPDNQFIFLNSGRCMQEMVARELLFEDEKYVETQALGEYATYIKGGLIRQRGARVVMDCTLDIAGAGAWPAWYTPTSITL